MKNIRKYVYLKEENNTKVEDIQERLGTNYSASLNYLLNQIEIKS